LYSVGFTRSVKDAYFLTKENSNINYKPVIVFTSHSEGENALYLNILILGEEEGKFNIITSDEPIGTA